MYIGHTSYHTGVESPDNEEKPVLVWPHAIEGLYVYDNIIERTGWDGLQVASATQDVEVYNNVIRDYGFDTAVEWQANGLQIGPGSTGAYYNNVILDGHHDGSGINNQGRGEQIFFNNLIVNSNRSGIVSLPRITESMSEWHETDNSIYFVNNTIINPATAGLHFYNDDEFYRGNVFSNNIVVKDGAANTDNFVVYTKDPTAKDPVAWDLELSNNLFSTSLGSIGFVDASEGDYRLAASSAAVDAGLNLGSFNWAAKALFDLDGNARPQGKGFDVGAYERKVEPTSTYYPIQPTPTPKPTPTPTPTAKPQPTYAPQPAPKDADKHWSAKAVKEMADLGALVLEKDGSFKPDKKASRAEFIDMLVKAAGLVADDNKKEFKDTNNHWAKQSIEIAAALGLVNGYDESNFGPDRGITREAMAVIVARALNLPVGSAGGDGNFKDGQSVAPWAREAVAMAAKLGLLQGYPDGSFQPKRELSRAEAITIILRIREHLESMKQEEE